MEYSRIVPDASVWEDMDGETPTIKKLNSFLTVRFILRRDVPADECLFVALDLQKLWLEGREGFEQKCGENLVGHFATSYLYVVVEDRIDPTPEISESMATVAWDSVPEVIAILLAEVTPIR